MSNEISHNRLVIIGNGFDLAHGLKTTYRDFLDWYFTDAVQHFCSNGFYEDDLFTMRNKYSNMTRKWNPLIKTFNDVVTSFSSDEFQSLEHKSDFLPGVIDGFNNFGWVDIEYYYFQKLKSIFNSQQSGKDANSKEMVKQLNKSFNCIIARLTQYIKKVNDEIVDIKKPSFGSTKFNIWKAFIPDEKSPVTFLNFNYTETLSRLGYANEHEIIHIHGTASNIKQNPLIFGYGDESDPIYQQIEDSGENLYLEHIKSFNYFQTNNYQKLISTIDSNKFQVYIVGHSCGLSDRILLNEIFEHPNCEKIEVFYHLKDDGSDNFKTITQEISRHFKPHNKNIMRRKVGYKDLRNVIPQLPK